MPSIQPYGSLLGGPGGKASVHLERPPRRIPGTNMRRVCVAADDRSLCHYASSRWTWFLTYFRLVRTQTSESRPVGPWCIKQTHAKLTWEKVSPCPISRLMRGSLQWLDSFWSLTLSISTRANVRPPPITNLAHKVTMLSTFVITELGSEYCARINVMNKKIWSTRDRMTFFQLYAFMWMQDLRATLHC
jgi:hypothetical protein